MISLNSSVEVIIIKNEKDFKNFFKKNLIKNEIIIGMGAGSISNWMRNLKQFIMKLDKNKLKDKFGKSIIFKESLSKYSWFNLGGPAEILFKPDSIEQLIDFLRSIKNFIK